MEPMHGGPFIGPLYGTPKTYRFEKGKLKLLASGKRRSVENLVSYHNP